VLTEFLERSCSSLSAVVVYLWEHDESDGYVTMDELNSVLPSEMPA
jgi:hypothetical protein